MPHLISQVEILKNAFVNISKYQQTTRFKTKIKQSLCLVRITKLRQKLQKLEYLKVYKTWMIKLIVSN